MTIEQGLQAYLTANDGIVAIVDTRVMPAIVAQQLFDQDSVSNFPAITYQVISARHVRSMGGSSGLVYKRVQITSWGQTYKAAKDLAEAVRLACDGFAGSMGDVEVQSCFLINEFDAIDLSPGDEASRVFGAQHDYMIAATEAIPTL